MPKPKKPRKYGSGHVLLVGGPYDGYRESGWIARGRFVVEGQGEYRHVLGADPMSLY
jgi:hypothetical protein